MSKRRPRLDLVQPNGKSHDTPPEGLHILAVERELAVPPALLARLRQLDQQIARHRAEMDGTVAGYLAGLGWDSASHDANLDLDRGICTLTPLPVAAEAAAAEAAE